MLLLKALLLFALPVLVLIAGGAALNNPCLLGAERAPARTAHAGTSRLCSPGEPQHLNLRLCGYGIADVAQQWGGNSDTDARKREHAAERQFLLYDLAFPLFYGSALCLALWLAWSDLGRPFAPAWLLAPVILGVVADWVENLIHLEQLRRFVPKADPSVLSSGWIQLASGATSIKLVLLSSGFLMLAVLSLWLMAQALMQRS